MTTLSDIYQKTKQLLEENADTNSEIDTKLQKYKSIDDFIQMVYQKIVQLSGEGDGS